MNMRTWSLICLTALLALIFIDTPMSLAQQAKDAEVDKAVDAGLRWLALHQAPDGSWSLAAFQRSASSDLPPNAKRIQCDCDPQTNRRNDIAATSFALLPFLAAGHTHKSAKTNRLYSQVVLAGLKYLLAKQGRDGYFGGDMYAHGLATMTLCEAYGLTRDPLLKRSAQAAVNYLVTGQGANGGWRYQPGQAGDLSVTGWQVQALTAAKNAKLALPKATLEKAEKFVFTCRDDKGGFAYLPNSPSRYSTTAVGLLTLQHLTGKGNDPQHAKGLATLGARGGPGQTKNRYYEYFVHQVMYHVGDKQWETWYLGPDKKGNGMRSILLEAQDDGSKTPHQKGSWGREDQTQSGDGGRIMATSLALLMLQVEEGRLSLFAKK